MILLRELDPDETIDIHPVSNRPDTSYRLTVLTTNHDLIELLLTPHQLTELQAAASQPTPKPARA
jgi:hypothetical protein